MTLPQPVVTLYFLEHPTGPHQSLFLSQNEGSTQNHWWLHPNKQLNQTLKRWTKNGRSSDKALLAH